jgi:hypothetical protein
VLEKTQEDHQEAFNDAIAAQNLLCKDIMDVTTTQCSELHQELINLRLATKQELTRLQGTLQVCFSTHLSSHHLLS